MNTYDKIKLLSGKDVWNTYEIKGIVPSISMCDGPSGIRKQNDNLDNLGVNSSIPATLFPAPATIACSFNPKIAYLVGDAIGKEARALGSNIVLAPGVNIKRNDMCGRNFEYYSEDPYLAGIMGKNFIEGIQSNNVGASLKHFACNNQEDYRYNIDAVIDERALREIYLKNFEIALTAKPKTVMCSYNKLNGKLVSENKYLLTNILRDEFKYQGLIVSDWGAISNRVKSLIAGVDLEMPSTYGYSEKKLIQALNKQEISDGLIDKSCSRVINLVNKLKDNEIQEAQFEYSKEIAKEAARESIVLLKNEDNILPLSRNDKILIVGEFASIPRNQGGGSSFVNPTKEYSLLTEINKYTRNYKYLNPPLNEELLNSYEKILFMGGLPEETEGLDRSDINLPLEQLKLIEEISKVNKNIIVNLYLGSSVAMPFVNNVKAIINSHLLGYDSGSPLLDILFGKISPSGRLAYTNPLDIKDNISTKNFANSNNAIYYLESIFVGYRYYLKANKKVLFPFGHGLSYSSFKYENLIVDNQEINENKKINLKFTLSNIGNIKASEVILLFIENNESTIYKPLRELRRFDKITLNPKASYEVEFCLEYNDFSYYDVNLKRFYVDKGKYKIQICKSANEVILEKEVEKLNDDFDFRQHAVSKYQNIDSVTEEDFQKLFSYQLPPKNISKKRPYTLDNNLEDVKGTLIGKSLYKSIFKEVSKLYKNNNQNWVVNIVNNTIGKTPLRTIAIMSNKKISLRQMEALIDLMNFKIFRGLIKIWQ